MKASQVKWVIVGLIMMRKWSGANHEWWGLVAIRAITYGGVVVVGTCLGNSLSTLSYSSPLEGTLKVFFQR